MVWSPGAHHGHAVPQVEREHDVLGSDGAAHGGKGAERRQRFQADDDARGAGRADGARPHGVGDAGVHEQRAAEPGEPSQQHALHGPAPDGVEIGDVAVLQAQGVPIGPHQRDRVTRFDLRADEHGSDGRVGFAPAAPRQHGALSAQVEHRDHAH